MQCISVVVEEKSDFHGVSNLETPPWFHVYPHCMSLLLQIHHIIGYLAVHPVLIVRGWKIPFFSWGHRLKSIRWSLTYSLLKYNFECTTIYIWLVYIPLYIYIHIIVGYIRRCLLVLFLSPTISMIHWINPLRPQLLLQQMDWFSWENLQEALFLFFNPIFTGVPSDFPPTMKSMEKSCILGAEIS